MSTYIIERAPNQFGGQQQAFVEASNAIVKNATDLFSTAKVSNQDLIQLFFSTLGFFGETRSRIAVSHGTEGAEEFGIRRDLKEDFTAFVMTPLGDPYDEYNDRLLPVIQKQLKTMEYDLNDFHQTKSQVYFDRCLARRPMMDYSIITPDLPNWEKVTFTDEDYERIREISEVPRALGKDRYVQLLRNKDALWKLREKSPNDYRRLKLLACIIRLRKDFSMARKSDWIHVTLRASLNGKMQDFSEYLTWANRDGVNDPVDRMTGRSIISVIHQDALLIETMLDDIAKIFKNSIVWNGENLKDLKDQVALFRYEHSHAMPFKRGSSAVAEWFERALYGTHGMKVTYNPGKMVDLEALTSTLKEFVDNYDSMITLTKLEENPSETRVEL
jgi:hypothetical protein